MSVSNLKIGALISYISLIATNLISLMYIPFMVNSLGKAEYGLYSLTTSLVVYFTMVNGGFSNAIVRYLAKYRGLNDKEGIRNLVSITLIIFGIFSLVLLIIGVILFFNFETIFASGLSMSEIGKGKILFALMVCNLVLMLPVDCASSIITAHERFIFLNTISFASYLVSTAATVAILFFGYKSIGIAVVSIISTIFSGSINIFYVLFILKVRPKWIGIDFTLIRELFKYTLLVIICLIADQINWRSGHIVLGILKNTSLVAVYAIGMNFITYYSRFSRVLNGMLVPRMTILASAESSEKRLTDEFIKASRIQSYLIWYILGGFVLFGQNFIHLWLGDGYKSAWLVTLIIMIPLTIDLLQNIGTQILYAKNMHGFRGGILLVCALLGTILSWSLVGTFGEIGAAIGTAVSLMLGNVIAVNWYYQYRVRLDMPRYFKEVLHHIFPSAACATILSCFALIIPGDSWIILFIRIMIFTVIFCLLQWLFGLNHYERQLIIKPTKSILKKVMAVQV